MVLAASEAGPDSHSTYYPIIPEIADLLLLMRGAIVLIEYVALQFFI